MVFKKDLIKVKKNYKIHTIRKGIKKAKICKNYLNVQDINSNSFKLQMSKDYV